MFGTSKGQSALKRNRKPLAAAGLLALLLAVPLAMPVSALPGDDLANVSPCVNGWLLGKPLRICFHTPGQYEELVDLPADRPHVASVGVWKYHVPTPGTVADALGELIIPCARVTHDASNVEPCASIGTREDPAYLGPYTFPYELPQDFPFVTVAYLVEMKLDVLYDGFGINDQDVLLVCRDQWCNRLV